MAGAALRDICFAPLPEFPLYALVPAIEALRLANQNASRTLYDGGFASTDGGPVTAGNVMVIEAIRAVSPAFSPDFVIVCVGNDPTRSLRRAVLDLLHRRSKNDMEPVRGRSKEISAPRNGTSITWQA